MPIDGLRWTACYVAATTLALMGAADATARATNPDEIIGNEECRVKFAREHALLYWPSGEGTRFMVLDGTGTVFGGELPFGLGSYRKTFLIERGGGSVLFAFADLADESRVFAPSDSSAPVRVYLDGKAIYETDNAGQFDVAADGSSFFAVEPLAQDMSRLTIREIDSQTAKHVDLAERFASLEIPRSSEYSDDLVYVANYTHTQDEVVIEKAQDGWVEANLSSGRYRYSPNSMAGSYLFYPIRGGERRIIASSYPVIFTSSRHAYFVHKGEPVRVSKKRFLWNGDDEPKRVDAWTRSLDLDSFWGRTYDVDLTEDGAWLMLYAANHHMLDATTGETVFVFPTAKNLAHTSGLPANHWGHGHFGRVNKNTPLGKMYFDLALARLRNVLPSDATLDDITVTGSFRVDNDELIMTQFPGYYRDGKQWKFEYVFDMDGIGVDAKPKMRKEVQVPSWTSFFEPPDDACEVGVASGHGLRVSGDKLIYRSREPSSHVD